ncbi:MAG: hypothetical protein PHT16_01920 [Candidatus Pacebacteria bacterium]|nr:hypothetical protein [Candidatus Paceibacterota bacterium]
MHRVNIAERIVFCNPALFYIYFNYIYGINQINKKEQENEALRILGMEDINKILQLIIDKKDQIDSLKEYIKINTEKLDKVITPP